MTKGYTIRPVPYAGEKSLKTRAASDVKIAIRHIRATIQRIWSQPKLVIFQIQFTSIFPANMVQL